MGHMFGEFVSIPPKGSTCGIPTGIEANQSSGHLPTNPTSAPGARCAGHPSQKPAASTTGQHVWSWRLGSWWKTHWAYTQGITNFNQETGFGFFGPTTSFLKRFIKIAKRLPYPIGYSLSRLLLVDRMFYGGESWQIAISISITKFSP